jgi:prevent-host-death family protein
VNFSSEYALSSFMETLTLEKARTEISALFEKAVNGEEFIITDNNEPIVKLVPIPHNGEYMTRVRALYELPEPKRLSHEEYKKQVRALRGSAPGIDTTVERDEDRI